MTHDSNQNEFKTSIILIVHTFVVTIKYVFDRILLSYVDLARFSCSSFVFNVFEFLFSSKNFAFGFSPCTDILEFISDKLTSPVNWLCLCLNDFQNKVHDHFRGRATVQCAKVRLSKKNFWTAFDNTTRALSQFVWVICTKRLWNHNKCMTITFDLIRSTQRNRSLSLSFAMNFERKRWWKWCTFSGISLHFCSVFVSTSCFLSRGLFCLARN